MFIDAFQNFIKKLQSGVEVDEWYLSDFVDENVINLSPSDAFELISYIIRFCRTNIDSSCMYEFLYILLALQRQSETFQVPLGLLEFPNFFDEILQRNTEDYIVNLVNELKKIYY